MPKKDMARYLGRSSGCNHLVDLVFDLSLAVAAVAKEK